MIDPDHPKFKKSKAKNYRNEEKRRSKRTGGRLTPGSGATPLIKNKGDNQTDLLVEETKLTGKKSYALKLEDLRKLSFYAYQLGKQPILCLRFESQHVRVEQDRDWAVVQQSFLEELIECYLRATENT